MRRDGPNRGTAGEPMTDPAAAPTGTSVPLKGMRRTAARRMVQAWQAPVFHLSVGVDMTEAAKAKQVSPGATVTDVLVAAAAAALVRHPEVNAHVGEDEYTTFDVANVGIAVATPKGLLVPVVHSADSIGLAGIGERRRDVVARARAGALTLADMTGGTFTISNLGMMGIDRFDAILNVPQAAILAVGSTRQQYVQRDGGPEWRPVAELTLTCDHRAIDGATGAAFLQTLAGLLTDPIRS